jgi:hypothetical protein
VKQILDEINAAQNEDYLNFIKDDEVEDNLVKLARILPSYTTNYQLKPIFTRPTTRDMPTSHFKARHNPEGNYNSRGISLIEPILSETLTQ